MTVRSLFLNGDLKSLLPHYYEEEACLFDPLEYLRNVTLGMASPVGNAVSLMELRVYMHNQLLRDTDVMSMAHSLEVRTPLLDHRLVEFLGSVPTRYKFMGRSKSLLLKASGDTLPETVNSRSKMGFTFPFERWLKGEWRATVEDILQMEGDEPVNRNAAAAHWQGFLRGQVHWSRIWALAVLRLWADRNIHQGLPTPST
ncbi:MAG: asparagine synthase-related protein [Nitrospinota bacterium]